jgi:hypothetical protein
VAVVFKRRWRSVAVAARRALKIYAILCHIEDGRRTDPRKAKSGIFRDCHDIIPSMLGNFVASRIDACANAFAQSAEKICA